MSEPEIVTEYDPRERKTRVIVRSPSEPEFSVLISDETLLQFTSHTEFHAAIIDAIKAELRRQFLSSTQ